MERKLNLLWQIPGLVLVGLLVASPAAQGQTSPDWSMNATIIEACSCPMFCQCYFNSEPSAHMGPAGHGSHHFCRFNNAFRVNRGHYGQTRLDGLRFWVAGDLGENFSDGRMDWAVLTFERSASKEQRDAVVAVLGHLYPVQWDSFVIAQDAEMEWEAGRDRAVARLNGGETAEVILKRFQGMTSEPVVIRNLKYWGAPRNDGFVLMPNEVEAYRAGERAFEYRGGNGFMITLDINSKDVQAM